MYVTNRVFPKLGEQDLHGYGGFGVFPVIDPKMFPAPGKTQTDPKLCAAAKRAVANFPASLLGECGLCPTCATCPTCEEGLSCEEQGYKMDGGGTTAEGLPWWWLLVAGGAGLVVGFGAAKLMTKKP